jgi:uncharacterized protein DUF5666
MQALFLGVTLAALSVMWFPAPYAFAADAKVARGTVVAIGGASLSVKVRDEQLTFSIDPNTVVEARGAGTRTRAAQAEGKPGPKLAEVLTIGQGVAVTYHEMNGVLHASMVRAVIASGDGAAAEPESLSSSGTVQTIAANTMTITGAGGGGATFTQTFIIDEQTKVFAKGAGTAAAAKGGRVPFTEIVASGDLVNVSYHKVGDALHAADVRVTRKASH